MSHFLCKPVVYSASSDKTLSHSPLSVLDRRRFAGLLAAAGSGLASLRPVPAQSLPAARIDPEAPLRVGMIGRSGHLGYVLDEIGSVPNARITAYAFEDGEWEFNSDGSARSGPYDMSPQREWVEGRPWAESGVRLYETYQEMLERERLDLAVVALPYARNAFAIAAAARAGVHVLSEKPVAVNEADLAMVESAVASAGIRLSAMFAMRYMPGIYTVREAIRRGLIGRPCLAGARKSYKWGDERPWFYRHEEIYGSTILWVGIHAVDYVRWATGLEVRKVSGFQANLAHGDYAGVQDAGVLSLQLDGDASASITMDFLRPDSAPTHGDDRLRVAGVTGVLEAMGDPMEVTLLQQGRAPSVLTPEPGPASLFADLVSELRGQGTHLIGPDEAVRVTRICIAATEAARTGRVLTV